MAWVSAIDLADEELCEAAKALKLVWIGPRRLVLEIGFEVSKRRPRDKIRGEGTLSVAGEDGLDSGEKLVGVERRGEVILTG